MTNVAIFGVELIAQTCCNSQCGIVFAVPKYWDDAKRRDHTSFYCPNGHIQSYTAESDVERLKREKEHTALRMQAQINEANHALLVAEKERDKEIRKRRKIERRVAQGVCPCCNRTFEDLARHMKTKHKEYALPPAHQKQITAAIQ